MLLTATCTHTSNGWPPSTPPYAFPGSHLLPSSHCHCLHAPHPPHAGNEKGQWTGAGLDGGNFGPGKAVKGEEAGQKANTAQGGQFGPDSYMFWKPQRQLLNNEPNGKKGTHSTGHAPLDFMLCIDLD
jgi:hypothetical protein